MKGGCWIATSVLLPGQRLVERNHSAANIHYHPRKRKTDSEGRIETQRAELTALKGYSQALKPNQKKKKKPICPPESQNCYGQWDSDGQRLFFDFPSCRSPFWTRMSAIVIPGVSHHFMLGMFGTVSLVL